MPRTAADQNKSDAVREYVRRRPNATALEVVRGVKREMGLEISVGHAARVKREAALASSSSNGASKADQIRRVAKNMGGKVRPRDVIAELRSQGVEVSSAQVSTVLRSMGMKRRRRGGRRPAKHVTVAVSPSLSLESLLAAKRLADQLGGVEVAKSAVDALAKLS